MVRVPIYLIHPPPVRQPLFLHPLAAVLGKSDSGGLTYGEMSRSFKLWPVRPTPRYRQFRAGMSQCMVGTIEECVQVPKTKYNDVTSHAAKTEGMPACINKLLGGWGHTCKPGEKHTMKNPGKLFEMKRYKSIRTLGWCTVSCTHF